MNPSLIDSIAIYAFNKKNEVPAASLRLFLPLGLWKEEEEEEEGEGRNFFVVKRGMNLLYGFFVCFLKMLRFLPGIE